MSVVESFLVQLGFDVADTSVKDAEKAIDQVTEKTEETGEAAEKAEKNIGSMLDVLTSKAAGFQEGLDALKGTFFMMGGAWVAGKLYSYVTETADKFSELYNISTQIGNDSPEQLAALQYAFESAGVEVDTLNDSLANLTDYLGQAQMGEGEGLEAFQRLGINLKNSNGEAKTTLEIFDELQVKMQGLSRAQQVAYINMIGLDTSLIQGMTMERDELNNLKQFYLDTYAAAGVSIDEASKDAKEFKLSLTSLSSTFEVMKNAIGGKFLGTTRRTFEDLRRYLMNNVGAIVRIIQSLLKVVSSVTKAFLSIGKVILDTISGIMQWWDRQSTLFKGVIAAITAATGAVLLFNSAFMKSPIGKLLTIISIIGMLIDDFQTWKEGGNSLIGEFIGGFDDLMNKIDGALGFFAPLIKLLISNLDTLTIGIGAAAVAFKLFGGVIGPIFTMLKLAIMGSPIGLLITMIGLLVAAGVELYRNWDYISAKAQELWAYLTDKFAAGVEFISGVFSSLVSFLTGIPGQIQAVWSSVISGIMGLFEGFANFILSIPDMIRNVWGSLLDWIGDKLSWVTEKVSSIKKVGSAIGDFFGFGGEEGDNTEQSEQLASAPAQASNTISDNGPIMQMVRAMPQPAALMNAAGVQTLSAGIQAAQVMMQPGVLNAANAVQNTLGMGLPYSPQSAAAAGGNAEKNVYTMNNGDTVINVQAASDPMATAQAIAAKQNEVTATKARNFRRNIS